MVPNRVISYDIQENRWLRRIIDFYESELDTFTKLVSESKKIIEKEITSLKLYQNIKSNQLEINSKLLLINQLESYEMVTQKILKISNIVKSQSWYHEISQLKDGYIPHVLVMDTRYSLMYKLYQELNNNEFQIRLDSEYSHAWKLTNKLYEIWCYIRICRMLIGENVNFRAKEWIFDNKKNTFLVPMLMPGTCMEFTRDNCLLKLYYDAIIPRNSNKTNLESNPIYTVESHNRPDARLDIYLNGTYMRSIIFEFKYRTIKNFWHRNNSTSYSQIISYRFNTISKFTQGLPQKIAREVRAVSEVWVFHPTGESENAEQKIEKTDEGIKLIRLKPGEDHSNIAIELNRLIERIIGVGE